MGNAVPGVSIRDLKSVKGVASGFGVPKMEANAMCHFIIYFSEASFEG